MDDHEVIEYIVVEQVCERCGEVNDHLTVDCDAPSVWAYHLTRLMAAMDVWFVVLGLGRA